MPRLRRLRRRFGVAHPPEPKSAYKPVYIYPGVIRMSGSRAIAIDTNCPAALFSKAYSDDEDANNACSVCLETFVPARDIVRRLPCGHVFHSRCILSWVCTADRCPNCNEPVLRREHLAAASSALASCHEPPPENAEGTCDHIPDVNPSTVCQLPLGHKPLNDPRSASDGVSDDDTNRSRAYSFVLHDQARFAELLERVFHTRWNPIL